MTRTARRKKPAPKIITLDASQAWRRCRSCERIGVGAHAGRCGHHRVGKDYPPIQQVFSCPLGRAIEPEVQS
jgi:hypothetical protein